MVWGVVLYVGCGGTGCSGVVCGGMGCWYCIWSGGDSVL